LSTGSNGSPRYQKIYDVKAQYNYSDCARYGMLLLKNKLIVM